MPRPSIILTWSNGNKQHVIDLYVDGAQPEAIANDIQRRTGLPCSKRTIGGGCSSILLRSTRWLNETDEEAQMVKLQEMVEQELEKGTSTYSSEEEASSSWTKLHV